MKAKKPVKEFRRSPGKRVGCALVVSVETVSSRWSGISLAGRVGKTSVMVWMCGTKRGSMEKSWIYSLRNYR